jgi:hypothetical protein
MYIGTKPYCKTYFFCDQCFLMPSIKFLLSFSSFHFSSSFSTVSGTHPLISHLRYLFFMGRPNSHVKDLVGRSKTRSSLGPSSTPLSPLQKDARRLKLRSKYTSHLGTSLFFVGRTIHHIGAQNTRKIWFCPHLPFMASNSRITSRHRYISILWIYFYVI